MAFMPNETFPMLKVLQFVSQKTRDIQISNKYVEVLKVASSCSTYISFRTISIELQTQHKKQVHRSGTNECRILNFL